MMTGLTRRRRTAQQILLRRACLSKSVSRSQDVAQIPAEMDRERGGIVVLPSLARDLELSRERKWQRDLAASTYRVSGDRKSAGKLPGCEPLKKDSRSWRKLKLTEDNTNQSGHSLKPKERSGGSARSRNSSSPYPSSWPLAEKAEAKGVDSKGSLDEIIHCSCLSRTPYDHKLSTPLKSPYDHKLSEPLKSDNSCQCSLVKKARRRNRKIKAVSVAQTQTQSIQENLSRSRIEGRTNRRKRSSKDRLRNRVYSGEDVCPVRKSSKSNSENSKPSSKCKVNNPGVKFKNYGGYSPSETDIETASDYKPNTPSRCSDSFFNKIEKVSRPPSLNGNKWSLKMPSNTEMQEYFDAADQENTCLNICLSNYNSSESQAKRSKTSRTSNDQFSGKGCSNTMKRGSDRTSRMSDSFQGSHGSKCSSKANSQGYPREEDRVEEFGSCNRNQEEGISPSRNREQGYPTEEDTLDDFGSCRINREAGISSRNTDQFPSNYEDENDINDKSACMYQSNTNKNESDPPRMYQTNSNEYSAGADPSYERLLPSNENYPNQSIPDEDFYRSTNPNQQLQHGGCGADMNQNQRSPESRPNGYKSGLGIAGTHRDPTNYPHRSRAPGPADRMGGSRGCCGTGNGARGNTRGPLDVENEWPSSYAIANRKCSEAVTQTSEFLMAPRTELSGGSCLHKMDQGHHEINRYSQMQPNNRSRMPQANEVKFNEGQSCGMNMNSQFKSFGENASNQVQSRSEQKSKPKPEQLVQTNSYVLQSDQKQYKLVQINSVELIENRSNQEAEDTPPCNQEKANDNPEKSQKSTRNRNRNRSRNRRRNRTTCEEFNTSQRNQSHDTCNGQRSDISDQIEDKCDVIKILDILQKTVAGLEKEINKAKGYESGRSNRSCCDPKMNKQTVANVDSRENCGQNSNSAPEPRVRPPYPPEFPDSYQQHNFPKPVCSSFNDGMDPERPENIHQTNNPYTNGNCGHNNGINPNNVQSPTDSYQDRNAPPPLYKCCNGNSPGSVEIPYRSAPDPGQAGDYATTEQDYPRDVHERKVSPYPYIEQTNLVSFQNNRMANDPQEHNSFPNTKWYGNNPQSNACSGMTEPRYGNYSNNTTQFGDQASKAAEYAQCQSMYKADEAPSINGGGVTFREYNDYSNERFERSYKETEEYPRCPKAAEYAPCHKADKPLPINGGGVTFQEYNDYSNEKLGGIYKESEDYPRLNRAETFHCQCMYKAHEAPPINRGGVTFPEYNDYSSERFDRNYKNTEEYPRLNRAGTFHCQSMYKEHETPPINRCGNLAPKVGEYALCHKTDKPNQINRGGITFQEYNDYSNERLERNYKGTEECPRLNRAESVQSENGFKCCNPEPLFGEREAFPFIRSAKPLGECLHNADSSRNGMYSKDPANRSTKPLSKGPQNTERSRKRTCSKDRGAQKYKQTPQRRRSRSPKRVASPKRQGSPKANKINKNRTQPKKADKVTRTKKESDTEGCLSPARVNTASNKAQHPVKVNKVCNKNVSKKHVPDKIGSNNTEQTAYKVFDCAFCENPNCPCKKTVEKKNLPLKYNRTPTDHKYNHTNCRNSNQNNIREIPECHDKVSKDIGHRSETKQRRVELCESPDRKGNHWEGLYENPNCMDRKTTDKDFNNKKILCENPQCPDKLPKNIEHRYEKVSRFELCENPNCPDRKTNKFNQEYEDATDSCPEYSPGRTRVLFDLNKNISRQGSGKSERFNDDPIETRICSRIKYHRHVEKSRLGRAVNCRPYEIETRGKPKVGECNLCLRPEMPPPICVRSRHNPYIKDVSPLSSYDRHILKNFESRKMEKSKGQKGVKDVSKGQKGVKDVSFKNQTPSPLKNQSPSTDYSSSNPEATVEEESSEEDAGKSLCSCPAEESYKHEERNSKSKSSIFSFCMKPPKEKTDRKQKVTRPQKETKIKENPESKQKKKSPSKSSGLFSCMNRERTQSQRERPQSKRENPKKVQEKRKQSEKTPSKSSGLLPCFKKKEERPPQEKEKKNSNTSIKREKESPKPKRETEEKPSWFKGLKCRDQSPREKKEKEIPPKEEKVKKPKRETEEKPSWFKGLKCRDQSPREKKEKEIPLKEEKLRKEKEIPPKEEKVKKPKRETEEKPSWFKGLKCRDQSPKEKKEKMIPQKEKLQKEKEIPQRKDNKRKEEKTKKPSKCVEFLTGSRKPKTQKEQDDELRPPLRIVCTNQQREQERPVDQCPCAEDQPREDHGSCNFNSKAPSFTSQCAHEEQGDEEVKVLYDSSFRFSPESRSCAEVPKIVYCHNNPQNPGQQESASSCTFNPQNPGQQESASWSTFNTQNSGQQGSASSRTFCRQGFEDPEDEYKPCASSNGFYKIVQ